MLGTVAFDSGAMDVEQTMEERHALLFDRAFWQRPGLLAQRVAAAPVAARRSPDAGGVFQPAPQPLPAGPCVCGAGRGAGYARDPAAAAALAW